MSMKHYIFGLLTAPIIITGYCFFNEMGNIRERKELYPEKIKGFNARLIEIDKKFWFDERILEILNEKGDVQARIAGLDNDTKIDLYSGKKKASITNSWSSYLEISKK